jgi:Peptidase A4 family
MIGKESRTMRGSRFWKLPAAVVVAVTLAVGGFLVGHAGSQSGPSAGRSAAAPSYSKVTARKALLAYLNMSTPLLGLANPGGLDQRASSGASQVASYNWSGYASPSTQPQVYTAVSASWTVPRLDCTREQELSAIWVGLDGYTTQTVEQDGVLAYCFEGQPSYYTWWEMYPGALTVVGSTVQPGDQISASVNRTGSDYTLSVTDSTNPANSFTTSQQCAPSTCLNESAEWIVERPSFSIGIAPLAQTTNTVFTDGSVTASGRTSNIAASPDVTSITMVDATDTYPLDNISGLFAGSGFAAHWLNSY